MITDGGCGSQARAATYRHERNIQLRMPAPAIPYAEACTITRVRIKTRANNAPLSCAQDIIVALSSIAKFWYTITYVCRTCPASYSSGSATCVVTVTLMRACQMRRRVSRLLCENMCVWLFASVRAMCMCSVRAIIYKYTYNICTMRLQSCFCTGIQRVRNIKMCSTSTRRKIPEARVSCAPKARAR